MATLVGFSVIAILYWLTVYWRGPATFCTFLWHLAIFEIATTMALAVNPQLEGMGGMLNLWIPSIVLVIVLGGLMLSVVCPS